MWSTRSQVPTASWRTALFEVYGGGLEPPQIKQYSVRAAGGKFVWGAYTREDLYNAWTLYEYAFSWRETWRGEGVRRTGNPGVHRKSGGIDFAKVVQALELGSACRIVERAPPTQKLPLFYLLDSISKNAGQPYTTHIFPTFLAHVYLRAYSQVDGITKKKMEDMLTTWRTTKGTGTPEGELFPREVRSQIEQAIYGRMIPAPMPAGNAMQMPMQQSMYPPPSIHNVPGSPFMPTPPQPSVGMPHSAGISRDSVTTTLLTTLSLKRALLTKNPHDTSTQNTVGILEQLQAHLNAGSVSQAELVAIQQQLDQFRSIPTAPSFPSNLPAAMHSRPAPPLNMPQPVQYSGGLGQATQSPQLDFSSLQGLTGTPGPAGGAPVAGLDFSSLLGNLARAGILSSTGTPVADGASTTPRMGAAVASLRQDHRETSVGSVNSRADGQHESAMQAEDEPDGMEEYEELILSMNVQLTLSDLSQ
ncbi:hypothetical protein QFC24_006717 [Naganishia onofrii]|uniref:Uncharacterized protein n=1 Tax=Naganishia onofrii TaxID=1851511 RepID=A0ACC2WXP5_9TREE|nr:hypothetical protein QFC24_006717 [Naganishia onofrii]